MNAEEFFGKVFTVDDAIAWREQQRAQGKSVVFTNGCFDLIHAGHVSYLAWARAQGDALIVGLNSDKSVRALKGAARPLSGYGQRAKVLCALRSVDAVVGFGERTPEVLIDRLKPDLHVKSEQYREDELPERDVVLQHGGVVKLAPHLAGASTTDLIAAILRAYGAKP